MEDILTERFQYATITPFKDYCRLDEKKELSRSMNDDLDKLDFDWDTPNKKLENLLNSLRPVGKIVSLPEKKKKVIKIKTKIENCIGDIEFFKFTFNPDIDNFTEANQYLATVLEGCSKIPKIEKLFGHRAHMDGLFYKCSINKKSIIQSLETLRSTKEKIQKTPAVFYGGQLKTAKNNGYGVHLYYAYENIENPVSLWYGVRWIRFI